jgi:hypothetical protein
MRGFRSEIRVVGPTQDFERAFPRLGPLSLPNETTFSSRCHDVMENPPLRAERKPRRWERKSPDLGASFA